MLSSSGPVDGCMAPVFTVEKRKESTTMSFNLRRSLWGLHYPHILFVAVALALSGAVIFLSLKFASPQIQSPTGRAGNAVFSKLPLSFEPNMGQVSEGVSYLVHARGGTFFFTPAEIVLALMITEKEAYKTIRGSEADAAPKAATSHIVRLRFEGANASPATEGYELLTGKVNYLVGNDPGLWRTNLPTYAGVTYRELYPGISLSYAGTEGLLKGTYTIAPGADPGIIRWRYIGASSTRISSDGDLIISGADGAISMVERAPVAWQEIDGRRVEVPVRYTIGQDGSIGFALGSYDKTYPLTIDPTLTYSTYLGGSGGDEAYGIDVDAQGNMYIVGLTQSANFPTANPFQATYRGGTDAFVTKMNSEGTALIYSTYLGGTGLDQGFAIALDALGQATITGNTNSTNFPVENPFQPAYGGGVVDSFASQLSASGSALIYSTYLGGSGFDTGQGVAIDDTGSAYIAGLSNSTNFPVVNAYQPTNAGGQDVTLTKLSPNVGVPGYSTYLGGSGDDFGRAIALDAQRNAYLTGSTISSNFPVVNAFQATCRNNCAFDDSFITKFNAAGSALLYSTYLGGDIQETGYGIAVDNAMAYSTGTTSSLNFPTRNPFQPNFVNYIDAYVTKIDTLLSGDASLIYSTYLGGNSTDYGYGITVDSMFRAYVTGYANSTNFPLLDPLQQGNAGGADAFVTVFAPSGSSLVFSTQLGGDMNDFGRGIAFGGADAIHVAGMSESTNFPLVNPYQPNNAGGPADAVLFKIGNALPPTVTPPPGTATSTATVTPTTAPPTATNTAGVTSTSTSTTTPPPVPCSIQFSDVDPNNTFYAAIRCLACRGIISGYADGTFRPNNQVTRGQLAKMVSNAAGFNEPVSGQTFADVPPTHTFYEFVERLTVRGYMTGYVCGGPGEPCVNNMPYFRPNANATRGQTSKIVSNAAGFTEPPSGQTFEDVPPSHTFYEFIQRLAGRNVMSGYPCGGPNEPCISGRPYFRPGNDVTRGQSAKIVANAFFPDCQTPARQ